MATSPTSPILTRLNTGTASASELEQVAQQSQSSVSRALRKFIKDDEILRIGSRRGTQYGLLRPIAGIGSQWPLRRVDASGVIHDLGMLHALAADEYFFDASEEALSAGFAYHGLSEGLPYFLQDQRPAGFLGRAVPQRYPELNLPQRTLDWTDDHYLHYLTRRGSDALGDLVVGKEALDIYLVGKQSKIAISSTQRNQRYPELAAEVMEGGLPGSSAHGEHPKFVAVIQRDNAPQHVLVKFSPPVDTPAGQRWADLLIAEHHAHRTLMNAGVAACTSEILTIDDRVYLQVDRFDRAGLDGRIGVTSLWAIDTANYGQLDNWSNAAVRLHRDRRIDAITLEQIHLISAFGALIANTDRHFGNLGFYDRYNGRFQLAPVYDMLPMLFAPEHNQIIPRTFTPPGPTSDTLKVWPRARELAQVYWKSLTEDARMSAQFRGIATDSLKALLTLAKV